MRLLTAAVALAVVCIGQASASPGTFSVAPDVQSMSFRAGEAQSTVVPPGLKAQCPSGRILITDDGSAANLQNGMIHWRDLDGGASGASTHAPVPHSEDYRYGTNDLDIVTLPNGDVVFETGAFSKRPITPAPNWFAYAYRGDFGPGARTTTLFFKSTDCGEHFNFVSEVDTAQTVGGECAFPQLPGKPTPGTVGQLRALRPQTLIYDMGGTDGQWLGVDKKTGRLTLIQQCVGRVPVPNSNPFRLSDTVVDKSYVFTSLDSVHWSRSHGTLPLRSWRIPAVSLSGNRLAVGVYSGVYVGTEGAATLLPGPAISAVPPLQRDVRPIVALPKGTSEVTPPSGKPKATTPHAARGWTFDQGTDTNGTWGWPTMNTTPAWSSLIYSGDKNPTGPLHINMINWTTLARVPGSDWVLLIAPEEMAPVKTFGSRLYWFDAKAKKFKPAHSILPKSQTESSGLMHVTVIDPGEGPVLLYWYDIDAQAKTASIRGRFVFGPDRMSADFDISRRSGAAYAFDLENAANANSPYWFGDYKSGGGFVVKTAASSKVATTLGPVTYRYYPVWVQPDSHMYYTRVELTASPLHTDLVPGDQIADLSLLPTMPVDWRPPVPGKRKRPGWAEMQEEQHEKVRGPQPAARRR